MKHSFTEKLAFSRGVRQDTDIETIMALIPGCVGVIKTDIEQDKKGTDYIATLRQGAQILIDAKARAKGASQWWKKDGPELALETWSVMPEGKYGKSFEQTKLGWTLDESKETDLILFTFDEGDTDKVFLICFQLLRMAFLKNLKLWARLYKTGTQDSSSWQSQCVFVPASVVLNAIKKISQGKVHSSQHPHPSGKYQLKRIFPKGI